MTQTIFRRELLIDAPLSHVWDLVATENGLRQWWGNAIALEEKEGGRCEEWRTSYQTETPTAKQSVSHWQGIVTIYAPPHQLVLTLKADVAKAGEPEFTTIAIALQAKGASTYVQVTQRAFEGAAARAVQEPRRPLVVPNPPRVTPMAQLDRLPPGTLPQSGQLPAPTSGQIDPSHLLVSPDHGEQLEFAWQQRLAALAAASQQIA